MSVARFAAPLALGFAVMACGGDDGSTASTVTAAAATSVATSPPATAPPVTVSCGSGLSIDPEGSLREQFVAYLASCGFTPDEAACLFDNLDFAEPAVAAGAPEPIVAAFDACGIDQARAAEIGG